MRDLCLLYTSRRTPLKGMPWLGLMPGLLRTLSLSLIHISLAAAQHLAPSSARWMPLSAQGVLDPLPLLDHLAAETDAARGAALFHGALAHGLARWLAQAAAQTGCLLYTSRCV